jgi:SH3-like domain-containing protein
VLAVLLAPLSAWALDYRSVAPPYGVFMDAPSAEAGKKFLVPAGYPVEIVLELEGWAKVRDRAGQLAWIDKQSLSPKRTVAVGVPVAEVRERPDDAAPVKFRVQQDVWLELIETQTGGWLKVRHRDGDSGFMRIHQAWGG